MSFAAGRVILNRLIFKEENINKNFDFYLEAIKEILTEAKSAEQSQQFDVAETLYRQVIQQDALNEFAYDRLIIIYRKKRKKERT